MSASVATDLERASLVRLELAGVLLIEHNEAPDLGDHLPDTSVVPSSIVFPAAPSSLTHDIVDLIEVPQIGMDDTDMMFWVHELVVPGVYIAAW